MNWPSVWVPDPAAAAASLLSRIERERVRAERAASIASRHEALARPGPPDEGLHGRLAAIHRRMEERHLVTAELYESLMTKIKERPAPFGGLPLAALLTVTARLAGSTGAIVALVDARESEAVFLASDPLAGRAHDVEYEIGQGPSHDAVHSRQPVTAVGQELTERWHVYGPAVACLEVRSVSAVPLERGTACLGALTLLNPSASASGMIGVLGDALVGSLLDDGISATNGLLAVANAQMDVQQAAGMISSRHGCSVADARVMIRARAFADGTSAAVVADGILRRGRDL